MKTEETKKKDNGKGQDIEALEKELLKDAAILSTGDERLYFHAEHNSIISGVLVRRDVVEDDERGSRNLYAIHTDRPTKVIRSGEKDPFTAVKGTVVHLGERHQMRQLQEVSESPEEHWIYVRCKGKREIGGGRSVWDMLVAVKATGKRRLLPGRRPQAIDSGMIKIIAEAIRADGQRTAIPAQVIDNSDIPF